MAGRNSPFYVPQDSVDEILEDISLRAGAKRKLKARTFNADLGETAEEADEALAGMRSDVNKYGEYVFGYTPARVHRYWNQQVDDVIQRRIRQNKVLI